MLANFASVRLLSALPMAFESVLVVRILRLSRLLVLPVRKYRCQATCR